MRMRTIGSALGTSLVALTLVGLASPALADPVTVPGGPWDDGNENVKAIHGYEQLWDTLRTIERSSGGTIDVAPAPLQSNLGRDIPVVTVGDGPVDIMFVANQHGDEYVVSEGMISIIRALAGNSTQAQSIRDALTVTIVPRVNVDGFDGDVVDSQGFTTPWRQNYDPACAAFCSFYQDGRGYDINRYHSYTESAYDHPYQPGLDADNPVNEAIAMRLLWDERQPQVVVDFHHQGSYVDEDGRLITGSIMWPNATEEAARLGISDEFAETITMSKRAVSVMLTSLEPYGWANITRYPSTSTPGIARNAYGLLGSTSVLFEVRGGIGQKSVGQLAKHAEVSGMAVLTAAADGSLWTTSTAPADNIRERGDFVTNPHEHE